MSISTLIVIFAVLAVVLGSIVALVWWHLADVFFPGTAEKTGQRIFRLGRKGGGTPPEAKVIRFDDDQQGR